jgi:hypothetical protein
MSHKSAYLQQQGAIQPKEVTMRTGSSFACVACGPAKHLCNMTK